MNLPAILARGTFPWSTRIAFHRGQSGLLACALLFGQSWSAQASGIFGTLSNFDVYNGTTEPSEGFEIELEGIHSTDVYNTFPSHYNLKQLSEYSDGTTFGTRIRFEDYHFLDSQNVIHTSINPNPNPQSTNGHFCVNLADCEHFGFAVNVQPSATRTFWLNRLPTGQYERIGSVPLNVPNPSWTYVPPAMPGGAPMLRAEVQVPEAAEVIVQRPDSIWMKVYKTEIGRAVDLDELMSGPGGIVPQDSAEIETEWELLEGGKMKGVEAEIGNHMEAIIRRYEYFTYTGLYDEEHQPLTDFLDSELLEPPAGELGNFIAANMVAANLVAPPADLIGDANGDCSVGAADYAIWAAQFGTNEAGLAADFDGNGSVGAGDYALWAANFGNVCAPPGAAVPEPGTSTLAGLGFCIALLGRTWRRQLRAVPGFARHGE